MGFQELKEQIWQKSYMDWLVWESDMMKLCVDKTPELGGAEVLIAGDGSRPLVSLAGDEPLTTPTYDRLSDAENEMQIPVPQNVKPSDKKLVVNKRSAYNYKIPDLGTQGLSFSMMAVRAMVHAQEEAKKQSMFIKNELIYHLEQAALGSDSDAGGRVAFQENISVAGTGDSDAQKRADGKVIAQRLLEKLDYKQHYLRSLGWSRERDWYCIVPSVILSIVSQYVQTDLRNLGVGAIPDRAFRFAEVLQVEGFKLVTDPSFDRALWTSKRPDLEALPAQGSAGSNKQLPYVVFDAGAGALWWAMTYGKSLDYIPDLSLDYHTKGMYKYGVRLMRPEVVGGGYIERTT